MPRKPGAEKCKKPGIAGFSTARTVDFPDRHRVKAIAISFSVSPEKMSRYQFVSKILKDLAGGLRNNNMARFDLRNDRVWRELAPKCGYSPRNPATVTGMSKMH